MTVTFAHFVHFEEFSCFIPRILILFPPAQGSELLTKQLDAEHLCMEFVMLNPNATPASIVAHVVKLQKIGSELVAKDMTKPRIFECIPQLKADSAGNYPSNLQFTSKEFAVCVCVSMLPIRISRVVVVLIATSSGAHRLFADCPHHATALSFHITCA
jgi:hypothetical protein